MTAQGKLKKSQIKEIFEQFRLFYPSFRDNLQVTIMLRLKEIPKKIIMCQYNLTEIEIH